MRNLESREIKTCGKVRVVIHGRGGTVLTWPPFKNAIIYRANYKFYRRGNLVKSI